MLSFKIELMKSKDTKGVKKIRLETAAVLSVNSNALFQSRKVKPISKMPP
jgi:hypothetical protein